MKVKRCVCGEYPTITTHEETEFEYEWVAISCDSCCDYVARASDEAAAIRMWNTRVDVLER
jgi:hypothetical protein